MANVTGTVEEAILRVTKVRDPDGNLHIIPNGQITQVTKLRLTQRTGRIDVPVGARVELAVLESLVQQTCTEFARVYTDLTSGPALDGLVPIGAGLGLRVSFQAPAEKLEELEMRLRRELYAAVTGAGFRWRVR